MASTRLTFLQNIFLAAFARQEDQRYASRYALASAIAGRMGFRLYNRNLWWYDDSGFLKIWRQFEGSNNLIHDRKYVLYSLAQSLRNLPGDTAECGVGIGATSFLICWANQGKPGYYHHAFDSFEGISAPEAVDQVTDARIRNLQQHDYAYDLPGVQRRLSRFDFIRYYPGWIPERFHEVADRQFSLVHIDVNVYQPTYDSLAFFYEHMVPGGIIVCDDYGFKTCPGATEALDRFIEDKPEQTIIHLSNGQGIVVKR